MVSLVSHRSTAVDAASITATPGVSSTSTTSTARSFQGKSLHMSLATPALIEFEDLRFYIVDCPTESTLPIYMQVSIMNIIVTCINVMSFIRNSPNLMSITLQ